jgi:signal transduction histidine kinase
MNKCPIKLKIGAYCALLTVLGLMVTAGVMLPSIYQQQLADLDEQLEGDAVDLFRRLDDLPGTSENPRTPVGDKFIPLRLKQRYIELTGRDGAMLYHSGNLRDASLRRLPEGMSTITLREVGAIARSSEDAIAIDLNCRIGTFRNGPFTLRVGTRLRTIEAMQEALRRGFYFALPIATLLIFAGGIVLAQHALRPVSAMTAAAERISAQHPDERLPIPSAKDEIARLSVVLNASFDRLQRAYNSAARFSADASHQLKTPIAVLRAGLDEMAACDYLQEQERETVADLVHQTRRLTTLVEDLLLLAQSDAGRLKVEPAPLDLVPVIDNLQDDLDALALERGLRIERATPEHLVAKADVRRVKIILQNLGENAVKYNRDGGRIRVSARRENGTVFVSVGNTGGAIPVEYRERMFDRFNRAGQGENIKGHGLGLNIARELARAHGGELSLARSDAEWTEFELRLPAAG